MPAPLQRRTTVDHDVPVPAFDGSLLATDIHRPVTGDPVGCLLQRVPYGKDVPAIVSGALDVQRALRRGYAVAIQDCRGRGHSEGTFRPFESEADDGEATVAWLAEQPWSNGRVGMFGRSYAGLAQWSVAAREVPPLRAIAPMFSGHDPDEGWLATDGAVEWGFGLLWCIRYLAPGELARHGGMSPIELLHTIEQIDVVFRDGAAHPSFRAVAELVPLLAEVAGRAAVTHDPDDMIPGGGAPVDGSGSGRSTPRVSTVPALVTAGWFDIFLGGALDSVVELAERGVDHQLVVGPWAHGGTCPGVYPERDFGPRASADTVGLTDLQLDWFDRWMSDEPPIAGSALGSGAAQLFVTGLDEWIEEPSWPPPGIESQRWFLTPHDGTPIDVAPVPTATLSTCPGDRRGAWSLAWDEERPVPTLGGQTFLPGMDVAANAGPRRQETLLDRDDVLVAVGDPVAEDELLEALGEVRVVLSVADAAAGTRWCARLVDVHDGAWMLVAEVATRPAGTTGSVTLHLRGVAHRWLPGHRPAVLISHTSWPRFDRRVGSGDRSRGVTSVRFGSDTPSYVEAQLRSVRPQGVSG